MRADDLQKLMREVDYGRFQDEGFLDHLGLVGKGLSLLFEQGIYEGEYFSAVDRAETTRNVLYDNGRKAAIGFLATWDFEAYKEKYRKPEGQG